MKEIFYDWYGYNSEIFHILNHMGNIGILPETLRCLSFFFNIENFAVYYFILCLVSFCRMRTRSAAEVSKPMDNRSFCITYNRLVFVGICYAVFGLSYAALKFSINMPRPFCSASDFQTILDVGHERCMSSFPSSHSGLALMVTILAWEYLSKLLRIVAIILVTLIAFSRIALGMHYPADIVYSYLIVLIVLAISYVVFKLFENNIIKYVGRKLEQLCRPRA